MKFAGFVFLGSITLAATAGLGAAGQLNTAFENSQGILIGVGSGIALFYFGKLLRLIGFRFGRDIIYEDFDRLSSSTKKLILESISLDVQKKNKESKFMPAAFQLKLLFIKVCLLRVSYFLFIRI